MRRGTAVGVGVGVGSTGVAVAVGTGVAVEIVRNLNISCLILEAPFSSLVDVSAHHYFYVPTKLLLKDRFESEIKIN